MRVEKWKGVGAEGPNEVPMKGKKEGPWGEGVSPGGTPRFMGGL